LAASSEGFAAAADLAGATRCHLLLEQLLASAGDGVWIQAKEFGQDTVATVSQLDRFHTGEQATLLFVQQTVEQHNGSLEFLGSGQTAPLGLLPPDRNLTTAMNAPLR
jgi:hypothetical protein